MANLFSVGNFYVVDITTRRYRQELNLDSVVVRDIVALVGRQGREVYRFVVGFISGFDGPPSACICHYGMPKPFHYAQENGICWHYLMPNGKR